MKSKTVKRLVWGVTSIIILSVCFAVTSCLLMWATVRGQGELYHTEIENSLFQTGQVSINLNDGNAVFGGEEFYFSPGNTETKEFFIENKSTCDVYYRVYFGNILGGLADVLEVRIQDGEKILYSGTPAGLTKENAAKGMLNIGERKILSLSFYFPKEADDGAQSLGLSFDLCADAVQVKNNPDGLFD